MPIIFGSRNIQWLKHTLLEGTAAKTQPTVSQRYTNGSFSGNRRTPHEPQCAIEEYSSPSGDSQKAQRIWTPHDTLGLQLQWFRSRQETLGLVSPYSTGTMLQGAYDKGVGVINPKPQTLNPKPQTPNPKPQTPNPEP